MLGCRWINNQRKSNSVWCNTPHWKIIALICCARRSPKVTLIAVFVSVVARKTSTVTPSFYYVLKISLSCNIHIPSFIGNLWWVLLLGNHLNNLLSPIQLYIDIWLSLNNTTTPAFFPDISVSPITLFHQINKKELDLHITPMKKS